MKTIKKLFITCAISTVLAINIPVNASPIIDVPDNYWAAPAILHSVQQNYIGLIGDKFEPTSPITRAEFANAIYNVINRNVYGTENKFHDVNNKTPYKNSILSLSELQVVFGYPDGNFKPESYTKRSEAASVIANIIKTDYTNASLLNQYEDKDDVPSWALLSYINDIANGIQIDYPTPNKLLPKEYLTRAEAAVAVVKLKDAINNYKAAYMAGLKKKEKAKEEAYQPRPKAIYSGSQTLTVMQNSYENKVDLFDIQKVIESGNMVPVRATQKVDASTVEVGQELVYYSPSDIYSDQGILLYKEGTRFVGYVDSVEKSYWFKKQHKAYIIFNKAILKDGTEFPIAGVLYTTYKGKVVPEKKKDSKKVQADIVKQYPQREAALMFSKKLTPMVKYTDDGKDSSFMLLTADMIIPEGQSL